MEINKDKGFVALYRSILDWEWWENHNATRVFLYCIIRANWQDTKWQGIVVKRGQFITGRETLISELRMSWSKINTALNKLIQTNEIAKQSTNRYTIITVNNYELYQDVEKIDNKKALQTIEKQGGYKGGKRKDGQQIDNKWTTNRQQIDTDNNLNNITKETIKSVNTLASFLDIEEGLVNEVIFAKRLVKHYYLERNAFNWVFTTGNLNEAKLIKSALNSIDEVRLLITADGYTFDDVIETIDFALTDKFWQRQLQGLGNLRVKKDGVMTKFDKINKQLRGKNEQS